MSPRRSARLAAGKSTPTTTVAPVAAGTPTNPSRKPSRLLVLLRLVAACMLGPCLHHIFDLSHLSTRVADLGWPFAPFATAWATVVCATETAGTLMIITNWMPRIGAAILLPKMIVAVYGHAFVEGFDAKFASSYATAYTPPGLSYNWSVGATWECGFFGAGYYLIVYALLIIGLGGVKPIPAGAAKNGVKAK